VNDPRKITHEFQQALQIEAGQSALDKLLVPFMLLIGVAYTGLQALASDWVAVVFYSATLVGLLALVALPRWQNRVLGQSFNRRHALYIALIWLYFGIFQLLAGFSLSGDPSGKGSTGYYTLIIISAAVLWMLIRTVWMLTRWGYFLFATQIPIWEQIFVAINEMIAAVVLGVVMSNAITRVILPEVFTLRFDPLYAIGLGMLSVLYYAGMQVMWIQRGNEWLSRNSVWVGLARVIAPLAAFVTLAIIARKFIERADLRTATLMDGGNTTLIVLSFAPVILLILLAIIFIVYTGNSGLRQRFLPDLLLDRLPPRAAHFMRSISDVDMLMILGVMLAVIPLALLLLGDSGEIVGSVREQLLQRGNALIETSEQALALLFALPFYALILALMCMYAFVISRRSLSAYDRDALVAKLPIGFLIILIITLYMFAIPFSQVLVEGRLPRLPQDSGRILLFNILIPLILLYAHYYFLVRLPYRRGQSRWREMHGATLTHELTAIDSRIGTLNDELTVMDQSWHREREQRDPFTRMEALYHYMQLNSLRDDMNMQRLRVLGERQQLAEISEAPISVTVARLPVRIVSLSIPVLLVIQIYQWALNNGLREIIDNPNLTVFDFFREILSQLQFQ
jgi:hypothetical protein